MGYLKYLIFYKTGKGFDNNFMCSLFHHTEKKINLLINLYKFSVYFTGTKFFVGLAKKFIWVFLSHLLTEKPE